MKELLRLGAVLTVLGIAAFGFVYLQMKKGYPLEIGAPAPAFSLPTPDGFWRESGSTTFAAAISLRSTPSTTSSQDCSHRWFSP
jgi:hypothetical protein